MPEKTFNRFEMIIDLPKDVCDAENYIKRKLKCDVVLCNKIELK